jgi:L-alanine-DL-glutamate epimerase-like enolase superfamily enzyme
MAEATHSKAQSSGHARDAKEDRGVARCETAIAAVDVIKLRLPYRSAVSFKTVRQSVGEYVILRIVLHNGLEGLAEAICRPEQSGEDATLLAYQLETFFKPKLVGADARGHGDILASIEAIRFCPAAKALIDNALWDLRGKIAGEPVWRLLGAAQAKPVPLTWIAHGNSREAMVSEARIAFEERGYKGLKLKAWRRSHEDVAMVAEVREAVGADPVIYIDGNGAYSESEARTILPAVAQYNVSFIEEPCSFADPCRQAAMAAALPIALLGDQSCRSLREVALLIRLNAVGAVSVKLRRTGITEALKIIALCEAMGIPVVIGTDSESRIGALARIHLRAAAAHLQAFPAETHFFQKLTDDVFAGEFYFDGGCVTPTDAPGFGAAIDRAKLEKYQF